MQFAHLDGVFHGLAARRFLRVEEREAPEPVSSEITVPKGGLAMPRTAENIKKDVVDQLYWDNRVDAAEVTVDVEDGKVVLRGTVPTLIARHSAAADVLAVAGVSALENQLKVRYPASVTAPSDEQIRSNVENLLAWSSHIDAEHMRVRVTNGIVTLEGSVDALWKKSRAEEIVSQLTGVTAIDNKLTGVPTKDTTDEMIAELVANALKRNPMINANAVDVKVANGVVRLAGAVPSWAAREVAYHSALYTFGAIGVDDQLVVVDQD
jgi:osmotically-inducible protein OsmY